MAARQNKLSTIQKVSPEKMSTKIQYSLLYTLVLY